MLEMPLITVAFLAGVVSVLWSIWLTIRSQSSKAIWFGGVGTIATVTTLLLFAGYNGTSYYPSTADIQSSLTITNSSSSYFTLKTMAYASLFIPFVVAYIWYAWKQMNKKKISSESVNNESSY